jgi:hypothetical protein
MTRAGSPRALSIRARADGRRMFDVASREPSSPCGQRRVVRDTAAWRCFGRDSSGDGGGRPCESEVDKWSASSGTFRCGWGNLTVLALFRRGALDLQRGRALCCPDFHSHQSLAFCHVVKQGCWWYKVVQLSINR